MSIIAALIGLFLITAVLRDSFETIILPRRVRRRMRLTVLFYRTTWLPWRRLASRFRGARRENVLSVYGPLALLLLLGIWAVLLIVGFGLLQWATGSHLRATTGATTLGTDLYMSGTTFFTLGLGDVVPETALARGITIVESGTGFGFLALVIGYLPVLYQAFSRRETLISLLDARAGSPPTALEFIRRNARDGASVGIVRLLEDWERWSAELMESHLSYPTLAYFRSHHENQSWVAALTVMMDICTLVQVGIAEAPLQQARMTFAIARHAAVDLSQVFRTSPATVKITRGDPPDLPEMRDILADAGLWLNDDEHTAKKLAKLRAQYEPYVAALGQLLAMPLPPWQPAPEARDDWQTSPEE
jgi:hypothetical protein